MGGSQRVLKKDRAPRRLRMLCCQSQGQTRSSIFNVGLRPQVPHISVCFEDQSWSCPGSEAFCPCLVPLMVNFSQRAV